MLNLLITEGHLMVAVSYCIKKHYQEKQERLWKFQFILIKIRRCEALLWTTNSVSRVE